MITALLLVILGFVASGFGTLIGFGGGVFVLPILIIVFKVKIHIAISAVAISLLPAALIATFFNYRERTIDPVAALIIEIPTIIGVIVGAYLTSYLSVKLLELIFGLFLLYLSIKLLISALSEKTNQNFFIEKLNSMGKKIERKHQDTTYKISLASAVFFGCSSGLIAGLFGIGGGFLKTPIMIKVFGMPHRVAIATALFMIVFTSLFSTLSHSFLGHFDVSIALPLVGGFSLGAFMGNIVKKHLSQMHTEKLIAYGLLLAGISVLSNLLN